VARGLAYAGLLGLGLASGPAASMTPEEAARINMELAIALCSAAPVEYAARVQSFRQAGFAERVEGPQDDITHYFTAPAGTAEAEFYHGQLPSYCNVRSTYVDVSAASAILDRLAPQLMPTYVREVVSGPSNPATGQAAVCVRYMFPNHPLGIGVAVVAGDGSGTCRDGVGSMVRDVGGP
jgi:hypothetical protein